MKIAFNPSTVAALITPPNNKDITFDLRGRNIFARGVKFCGTDTWRDIKINNVSIGSNILDLRNGSNTTLTNTNGVVTINSTWRPVVDNLTSDSTTSSLSAKQGKILKSLIDGKSNSGHTHDDRYLRLTGGTMAGNALITFADSGSWGTDKGPQGARGGLYWTGQSDYAKLYAEETVGDNLDLVIQFGDDNSNGLSIRNKANTQTSYISAGGVITTGTFKGNLDWSYITNKPSSYTPSAHTHAWNSLTHSSTTENQAILTNGKANGWKLYTLNISRWDNAANNAHSHANKSVLDGITSALVNNWNIAYNFVHTITGTDTDKVINKWDEIVNFLAGITEDNKLNTLLNNKLSVYKLADNTNVGAIKNNGIYYSTTDASSGTLTNSPFNTGFALINMTSYDGGDDLRRSRLAFNAYGEIKVSNDRGQSNTTETWYQVLTSHNTYISNGSGIINGTTITQVSNADTTDGVHLEWSGQLTYDQYSWLAGWTNDGKKIKAVNKSQFATSGHTHDGRYVRAFGTSNDNIDSDWGQSFKTFDPIPSGTPPEQNPNISILNIGNNFNRRKQLAFIYSNDNIYYRRHVDNSFTNWRRIAFANEIPTSLKNPYALTISLNGTSQGPYDGSAAKNINITPGSIGAAVSNHSHDYLVVNAADNKSFNSAYHNFQVLYAGGGNGITGKPTNVDAFGLFKFRVASGWSGQMLLANRGSLYIRSSEDAKITNTLAWKTILDSSNYSGILDSRYYTESEVNSLLDAKLNRQNLSYGTWNPRGYNLAADYYYNGGDLSISESGGKIHISVDGYFWQNEGQYRVLDTSDISSIRGGLTLYQHLSATDTTRYPLVWGGSDHKNTNNSTGSLYKSYDKLSWQTSSQTLYATNIQTENIKHLSIGGGIYWNPYVESTTDGSDSASITVVRQGVAGGTTLVLSQMNDANDTIQFQTNGSARLYHNSYPILTTQNTYVSNNKGYINGTEITQVNNASNATNSINSNRLSSNSEFALGNNFLQYFNTAGLGSSGVNNAAPDKDWWHIIRMNHPNSKGYFSELAIALNSYNGVYWRTINAGREAKSWTRLANIEDLAWNNIAGKPSSYIPSAHTHTVFKNNLMIKGTNGISDSASIHLGIGDSDTGFKWISDGKCQIYANNSAVGEWTSGGMNWFKNPTVNGNKVWNAGNDGSGSGLDADKIDGYHASSLWRSDGATWNPNANVSLNASANSQEWSFDIRRNGYTGCYWHVWDSSLDTMLKVNADNGKVYAPYNFVGNLEGNASTASKLTTARKIWGQSFDGTGNVDNTLRIRQTTGNWCEGIRIQTADSTWATIILGATGDSGTNANAWSIHRKSDNNFAISRNSSDGTNGLVMTSVGMGLGTTAPTQRLDVHGNIRATGNSYATHFYESSDKTLKKNIKSILSSTNIPKIREFDWKDTEEHSYGFIAQELEEQGYGCLVSEANGKKTVNYTATLALTVAKLQNLINIQNKKISNLTKELKALKYGRKKNS